MKYQFKTTPSFDKEFKKFDNYTRLMIKSWIRKNLIDCEDPKAHGKALIGKRKGQWRYRIGNYRLICMIKNNEFIILALSVEHRREIYD